VKIDPLYAVQARALGTAQLLLFRGDADFASKLTLGQIIKGRVLRSYEGHRYLVEFYGHEKVVDSAVPLRTDEVIHGRVVGLGEQVELHRINPAPADAVEAHSDAPPIAATPAFTDQSARMIASLFERYQAKLGVDEMHLLQRYAARAARPEQMALSGLILNKLGLQIAPDFFKAIASALAAKVDAGIFALPANAIRLVSENAGADNGSTQVLAGLLNRMLMDIPEARFRRDEQGREGEPAAVETRADRGGTRDGADYDLARWILNAQTGGAIAHRIGTLPLLLDGELVELDVALFEQASGGDAKEEQGIKHRELVFALNTEALGRIEIRSRLAGDHMRVEIVTGNSDTTQFMSVHAGRLAADLEATGWHVDELRYETRTTGAQSAVMQSLVEHVISPGSVSRLA
jgi:hypothetical protein